MDCAAEQRDHCRSVHCPTHLIARIAADGRAGSASVLATRMLECLRSNKEKCTLRQASRHGSDVWRCAVIPD